MKSNNLFRDQVKSISDCFKNWNECEQTVALYSLLKGITPTQGKFLVQVLEQSHGDNTEIQQTVQSANDPVFIRNLLNEPSEKIMSHLLSYLPLLHMSNELAKTEYLQIIPEVLNHSIEKGVNIEECRQLLSYSLIHPAINTEERKKFRMWLGHLEERFTYSIYHNQNHKDQPTTLPSSSEHSDATFSQLLPVHSMDASKLDGNQNGWSGPVTYDCVQGNSLQKLSLPFALYSQNPSLCQAALNHPKLHSNGHLTLQGTASAPADLQAKSSTSSQGSLKQRSHTPLRRTNAFPASPANISPSSMIRDWLSNSKGDEDSLYRCRSLSAVTDHAPLSPQSSVTSSGSSTDAHHDDAPQHVKNSFVEENSGMREVPIWLKSLRLHKYAPLFQRMSYEEMLSLNEDFLEQMNVTKGARNKIVLSIKKLQERQSTLRQLEKDISSGDQETIKSALSEMKVMLNTPIKKLATMINGAVSAVSSSPSSSTNEVETSSVQEGDVPGQFTRLMGKVCTQILVASRPDNECPALFLQLIDKCINHEAFTEKQKKLLYSWKQQILQIWQPSIHRYGSEKPRKGSWGNTFPMTFSFGKPGAQKQARIPPQAAGNHTWTLGAKVPKTGSGTSAHIPLTRNHSNYTALLSRSDLSESAKQSVIRTQSLPPRGTLLPGTTSVQSVNDTEINAQLDSLCRSMTEHALGSLDHPETNQEF